VIESETADRAEGKLQIHVWEISGLCTDAS